jgi:hypothetical protein
MENLTLNGKSVEVISKKSGWVSYYDESGTIRKARASAFEGHKARKSSGKSKAKGKAKRAAKSTTVGGNIIKNRERYAAYDRPDGQGKSLDAADKVAKQLRPMTLEKIYTEAARQLRRAGREEGTVEEIEADLHKRYGKLNPGQQRMNLGNRIRGALRAQTAAE